MERAGEHRVPAGPLAVRWLAYSLPPLRAGVLGECRIALANAGSATWRDVKLAYHWLDDRGNPIVWDGLRTELGPLPPGGELEVVASLQAPLPPGAYRLAFDLVLEHRYWLGEIGNAMLELDARVGPRIGRALALAAGGEAPGQEEALVPLGEAEAVAYLAPGCVPAPDWSRRLLDAHQEGYAAVGGSVLSAAGRGHRARARRLAPWAERSGRIPGFAHPLLCPSLVLGARGTWLEPVQGLPAFEPARDESSLYDGRIAVALR